MSMMEGHMNKNKIFSFAEKLFLIACLSVIGGIIAMAIILMVGILY